MPKPTDDRLMMESYEQDRKNKIDEGILDRLKARGAGVKGRAKAVGRAALGKSPVSKSAPGMDERAYSIASSHIKKIEKAILDFNTDLQKLGMDVEAIRSDNPDAAAALTSLQTSLNALKTNMQRGVVSRKVGSVNPQRATTEAPVESEPVQPEQ
jgi:hypothetical protein